MKALLVVTGLLNGSAETVIARIPSMEACAAHFIDYAYQIEAATGIDWQQVSCIALDPWRFPL